MISSLLFSAPSLAVYIAGAVLASRRMQRHPGPSRTVLLACALLIAAWLISQAALAAVVYRDTPDVQRAWLMTQSALARIALSVAGMALLLKAVYADREAVVVEILYGHSGETMPEESADRRQLTAAVHSPGKYPPTTPTPTGFPILSPSHFD